MEPIDWRSEFPADCRERVVDKMVNTIRKRFQPTEQRISEFKKLAVNFEEKVYTSASNQHEYVTKIMARLHALISSSSNPPYSSVNTSNPGGNQGQSIAVQSTDQSRAGKHHSRPNIPYNIASGGVSANLTSARPTFVSVSAQVSLPNSVDENSNSQSIFDSSQNSVENLSGHGAPLNVSANNLIQERGRQDSPNIDTRQNNEQLNTHLCVQVEQDNISPPCITQQTQLQQQYHHQQKLFKPTQQHTYQQSVVKPPALRPSEMHVSPLSDLRQDQISSFEQTPRSLIKNHLHTASRHASQSRETPGIHQNVSSRPENLLMQSQDQPHSIGRKLTAATIQRNQLNGQPSGVPHLQQQQPRLPCQQNNVKQRFQAQEINISSSHHDNISVQHQNSQLPVTQYASSGMHQFEVKVQGTTQQVASALMPNQGQRSQLQIPGRQLNAQSQPEKMQQLPNPSEQDQQKTYQTSGTLTSTSEKRVSLDNWQEDEDAYLRVQSLKSKFLRPLSDMLQKITCKLQELKSVSQPIDIDNTKKLEALKNRLSKITIYLNVPKNRITPRYKETLGAIEKHIMFILGTYGRTPQVQTQEEERRQQLQSVNLQCSATTQRSNVTNLVNDSKSLPEHPTQQHGMVHPKKNSTEQCSRQGNALNVVQQVASGSSKIPTSTPQKPKVETFLSQILVHELQSRVSAHESSCSTLHDMHLKEPTEKQDVQSQSPKHELQRHKIQQKLVQNYGPVKFQSGASFLSLPKILGSPCQQVPPSSSQVGNKNLPMALTKARITSYPISSPSIEISSLVPSASSSMPGGSVSNAGNIGDRQVNGAPEVASSVFISSPEMSSSPLPEVSSDDNCNTPTIISDEMSASEQPIQRLTKLVHLMSSKALSASVLDIGSVVCTTERISGSETVRGSRGSICEGFVAMANSHVQKSYLTWQEKTFRTRKMKRFGSTVPINVVALETGSILPKLSEMEKFDLDSTAISFNKRPKIEVDQTLLEEITAINDQLIDTVLDISDDYDPSIVASTLVKGGKGTIVRCSFIPVTISPNLKSEQLPIQPLRLLVPQNYPLCSPIFLDKLRVEVSDELEDLSAKVKSKLNISLRGLTEPLSLGEIARAWDVCARAAVSEYAQQIGGGNFSSMYGTWEDCLSDA